MVSKRFAELGVFHGEEVVLGDFILELGDYRLHPESPAIDAAETTPEAPMDFAGLARPCGGSMDIGAHEFCEYPPFRRGDVNADRATDLSDAIFCLGFLFLGGDTPTCESSADVDDSGGFDISDPIFLLNRLFLGGNEIPFPFPECGLDPTPDSLSCRIYRSCPSDDET